MSVGPHSPPSQRYASPRSLRAKAEVQPYCIWKSRERYLISHATVDDNTTAPAEFLIWPVSLPPWMKVAEIRVAPAATSFGLLSKSNSTCPLTAVRNPDVAEFAPEMMVARYRPAARLFPSTDALDLPLRRSQRTRMVRVLLNGDAVATEDESSVDAVSSDGAATDDRPSLLQAAVVAATPAAPQRKTTVRIFMF